MLPTPFHYARSTCAARLPTPFLLHSGLHERTRQCLIKTRCSSNTIPSTQRFPQSSHESSLSRGRRLPTPFHLLSGFHGMICAPLTIRCPFQHHSIYSAVSTCRSAVSVALVLLASNTIPSPHARRSDWPSRKAPSNTIPFAQRFPRLDDLIEQRADIISFQHHSFISAVSTLDHHQQQEKPT